MNTTFRNHQERFWNIQYMKASLERLLIASKDWGPADAARGEKTIKQLEKQIATAIDESLAA